mmetsp:Transcript_6417/g.14173  ORF Transcript_6417/g.14173 Transcript_6417/m.14173 type:complete len:230 (+) Transcript_6417:336-1025(+)
MPRREEVLDLAAPGVRDEFLVTGRGLVSVRPRREIRNTLVVTATLVRSRRHVPLISCVPRVPCGLDVPREFSRSRGCGCGLDLFGFVPRGLGCLLEFGLVRRGRRVGLGPGRRGFVTRVFGGRLDSRLRFRRSVPHRLPDPVGQAELRGPRRQRQLRWVHVRCGRGRRELVLAPLRFCDRVDPRCGHLKRRVRVGHERGPPCGPAQPRGQEDEAARGERQGQGQEPPAG